jgi:hypothetical protein
MDRCIINDADGKLAPEFRAALSFGANSEYAFMQ